MHPLSLLAAGLIALALAGCGSEPLRRVDALATSPKPLERPIEQARAALAAAPSCCSGLDQLPYEPLEAGFAGDVLIDSQAPAYRFETGKSFLRAFKLPAGGPSFELRLYSQAGSSVLAPNAMLLDSRMRPTRLLDADDFVYVPPTGLKGDSLDARLRIDRSQPEHPGNERYLILYTSEAQMAGQTTLEHPAKAYAKALGNEPPSIPDPVAQHSPVGVIKLVMIPTVPPARAPRAMCRATASARRWVTNCPPRRHRRYCRRPRPTTARPSMRRWCRRIWSAHCVWPTKRHG